MIDAVHFDVRGGWIVAVGKLKRGWRGAKKKKKRWEEGEMNTLVGTAHVCWVGFKVVIMSGLEGGILSGNLKTFSILLDGTV
jgi:hypothetical protein